jgi:hypothetical protein
VKLRPKPATTSRTPDQTKPKERATSRAAAVVAAEDADDVPGSPEMNQPRLVQSRRVMTTRVRAASPEVETVPPRRRRSPQALADAAGDVARPQGTTPTWRPMIRRAPSCMFASHVKASGTGATTSAHLRDRHVLRRRSKGVARVANKDAADLLF